MKRLVLGRSPVALIRGSATRYTHWMAQLSPIESDFATVEDAEAYDAWFRAKVEKAMTSTAPGIPHDQVMAEMRAIIARHQSE
jgi:hypothetical protein